MKPAHLVLPALLAALPAGAQTPPLGPQLQNATIIGRGSTIIIKRLPVRTPDGIVYRDITIDLKLDPTGAVRADATGKPPAFARPATAAIAHDVTIGQITETAAVPEIAAPFTPGLYRDRSAGGLVRVIDQGRRIGADFPTWSLSAESGDTVIGSADWYGGPLRTNPHRGMVERAGIIDDRYSFGVVQGQGGGHFDQGMLIGAVQTGKVLKIVSFHRRGCCTYSATPTSEITYEFVGR